jgi:hypothetical protein
VTFLKTDKGIPFSRMFAMKDYPTDMLPLYSQGYALAEFLITQGGRRKFIQFIEDGLSDEDWPRAVEDHYGHESLLALQNDWLDWVRAGRPLPPEDQWTRPGEWQLASAELPREERGDRIAPASSTPRRPNAGEPGRPAQLSRNLASRERGSSAGSVDDSRSIYRGQSPDPQRAEERPTTRSAPGARPRAAAAEPSDSAGRPIAALQSGDPLELTPPSSSTGPASNNVSMPLASEATPAAAPAATTSQPMQRPPQAASPPGQQPVVILRWVRADPSPMP